MNLDNYLQKISDLDEKNQLKVRVRKNPLREVWLKMIEKNLAEEMKLQLIRKYKLEITTRSFENYVYGNSFPLYFGKALIEESGLEKVWDSIFEEAEEFCYRSTLGGKTSWIKLPKVMDKNLAYLAGAIRDGYVNLKTGAVAVVQKTCKPWLEEKICPIFNKLFGVELSITDDRALIYSYPIAYFLCAVLDHPPGKQTTWATPKILFGAPYEMKALYMRGYFDAEGTSDPKRLRIRISQSWHDSKNKPPSLIDMVSFLKSIGVKSSVEGPYYHGGTNGSNLTIYCKENPLNGILFFEKVGSSHPDKGNILKKVYESCRLARSQKLARG